MNETLKVLESRRSCRNFKPDMIAKEDLDAILKAGTYAATGMGKQSPIISVYTKQPYSAMPSLVCTLKRSRCVTRDLMKDSGSSSSTRCIPLPPR